MRFALAVALFGLLVPSLARADQFHHQAFPLGERALGMGGAFTGVANDPSSSYYNPAGLARLDDLAVSASITLNALARVQVNDGLRGPGGEANLKSTSRPTLPAFASLVKQLGWHAKDQRRHAIALSTFTPDRRNIGFDASVQAPNKDKTYVDTLSMGDERTTRWYGLSYAYRINDKLSAGISAFLTATRTSHAEDRLDLVLGTLDPTTGLYAGADTVVHSNRTSTTVKNGVVRLGFLYAQSARLRIGVMFQPPSFQIRGKAQVAERVSTSQGLSSTPSASYYDDSQGGLTAHDPVPWELRLGLGWVAMTRLLIALDVSAYGRRGSAGSPVQALGKTKIAPGTDRAPSPGVLILQQWYGKRTANVATGAEYNIRDVAIVRAGFFTDLSGAPNLPKNSTFYRPADINRLGGTLSAGIVSRGYDLSLGVAASFGWGKALAFVADDPVDPYRRTNTTEQTIFIFLSGARNAAGQLAEDTYRKLRERMNAH